MAEIKSRETNPVPGIDYSEICIPDEQNLGTGTFTIVLRPDAMAKINPIISSITNVPVFQLIVNINGDTNEITSLLGKADKSPALSRKVFKMPDKIETSDVHSFEVVLKNWEIKDMLMNGGSLQQEQKLKI